MIELRNIKKSYEIKKQQNIHVLRGVSERFEQGEFVAILGESGSGKTTLLNILGGLDKFDQGKFLINEVNVLEYTNKDWDYYRNKRVSFIFQNFNLLPHLTALQNVELTLIISGLDKLERQKKAIEILTKVGLGNQIHKKPEYMSGGEQQRVAIARALVNDPDIILADEPTGQLDEETSRQILDLLKQLGKDKLVIIVSHMEDLISEYATKIIRLKEGKFDEINVLKEHEIVKKEENRQINRNIKFNDLIKITLKSLLTRKLYAFLIILIMMLGTLTLVIIPGIGSGINKNVNNLITEDYNVGIFTIHFSENPTIDEVNEKVNNISRIKNFYIPSTIIPIVNFDDTKVIDSQFIKNDFRNRYTEFTTWRIPDNIDNSFIKNNLIIGKLPNEKNEILIGRKTAIALLYNYFNDNLNTNEINDKSDDEILSIIQYINLQFFTEHENDMEGRYYSNKYKIYFQTYSSNIKIVGIVNDDNIVSFTESMIEDLRYYPRIYLTNDLFNELYSVYFPTYTDDIKVLNQMLIETDNNYFTRKEVIKDVLSKLSNSYYEKDDSDEAYERLIYLSDFLYSSGIKYGLLTFLIVSLISGAIIQFNILKRKLEFGVLFSLGLNKISLFKMLVIEGIILATINSFLTIISSLVIKLYLNQFALLLIKHITLKTFHVQNLIYINWYLIILVFILMIISLLTPLYKIFKLNIIDVLREE